MASPLEKMRSGEWFRQFWPPSGDPLLPAAGFPAGEGGPGSASADELHELFELAPVGYLQLDRAGCIRRINLAAAALLGWDADWLHGKSFGRWVDARDRALFRYYLQRLARTTTVISHELRIRNRQGRGVGLRLEGVAAGDDGSVRCALIDVSSDQQSARRRHRLQSRLENEARLLAAGEMVANLAHELNQPLGTIVLNCDAAMRMLASDDASRTDCREALQQATGAANFASEIIRHLRGFLRNDNAARERCCLSALIGDALNIVEADATDNDVDVSVSMSSEVSAVCAAPVQVTQVLINLVRNSIEALATGDTGARRVLIRAANTDDGGVRVSVMDNGPGFTPAQRATMFDAFYSTRPDGMGIGLSLSRSLIEAHGGRLWADSDVDDGAVLHFTLPAYRAQIDAG